MSFLSYGGWYYGRATGIESKNVELRLAQHRAAADRAFCSAWREASQRRKFATAERCCRRQPTPRPLRRRSPELEQLARKAERAEALDALLGLEGTAARTYFGAFTGMIKGDAALSGTFDLDGRNRRPPKDPINALLSFVYSLLTKDFALALSAVGLDPLLGFYHQPRFGRPALALDLMEEFRPLVADFGRHRGDRTAEKLRPRRDFLNRIRPAWPCARRHDDGCSFWRTSAAWTSASLTRSSDTGSATGGCSKVQARLLARCLLGEIEAYPSFRTR